MDDQDNKRPKLSTLIRRLRPWRLGLLLVVFVIISSSFVAWASIKDLGLVETLHDPQAEHVDQEHLLKLVVNQQYQKAFEEAFMMGDELFETRFNALDGVGANVGQNLRFTRVPRADLTGKGEWADHFPARSTGPNAESCNSCHNQPFDDGAGSAALDVHRDPFHTGELKSIIRRNTPHLFAIGAVQRLAEEMTGELHDIRDRVHARACLTNEPVTRRLSAKGVYFGSITVTPLEQGQQEQKVDNDLVPCKAKVDMSEVVGVDRDLVVRPFQWKGNFTFVREFNRDASHNELGMQPVETAGDDVDGDFDGVVNELTIGDQTALAIYLAAQPRPTTRTELASLGLIPQLTDGEARAIRRGDRVFHNAGCAVCHVPDFTIDNPTFSEPSRSRHYRDRVFPAGQDPVTHGVNPAYPVNFDLTQDQPDNQIEDEDGNIIFRLGSLERDRRGRGIVSLYGDLKRHDMGPELSETIDEVGTGASVFLTENLWGVGSTAPYLHDGRATTLTEAILAHGGEAADSRTAFLALAEREQQSLIAFLNNLVLFKIEAVVE